MPVELMKAITAPLGREIQAFCWGNEWLVIALECSVRDGSKPKNLGYLCKLLDEILFFSPSLLFTFLA